MSNKTTSPAQASCEGAPEFCDHRNATRLFGLSRSSLYRLVDDGCIRAVTLRRRGALRGRRLFDCDSIRQFLRSQMEGARP